MLSFLQLRGWIREGVQSSAATSGLVARPFRWHWHDACLYLCMQLKHEGKDVVVNEA